MMRHLQDFERGVVFSKIPDFHGQFQIFFSGMSNVMYFLKLRTRVSLFSRIFKRDSPSRKLNDLLQAPLMALLVPLLAMASPQLTWSTYLVSVGPAPSAAEGGREFP
jgi:hypothetical protein